MGKTHTITLFVILLLLFRKDLNIPENILFFDGVCVLCSRAVSFIARNDSRANIWFVPLQSETGMRILGSKSKDVSNTIVYKRGDALYTRSTAVLYILKDIRGFWSLLFGLIIIPRFLRDYIYNKVAGSRYRVFGELDSCNYPAPGIRQRMFEIK